MQTNRQTQLTVPAQSKKKKKSPNVLKDTD